MGWNNDSVYHALVKKGNYEKKSELNKYVSIYQQKLRNLNSVLYRPDSQYVKAPVHINKGRSSFSKGLFEKIAPALDFQSSGSHDWEQYRVIDWGRFAKGLGLVMDSQDQLKKRSPKETPQKYKMVRKVCIQCFELLGEDSSFKKNGNVIGCMKVKAAADWPEDWIDYVVKNAGDIIKGVEIKK